MVRLTLPLPVSVNSLYATVNGRRVKTAKGRQYTQQVQLLALASKCQLFEGDVGVRMHIYRRQKRGDIDNLSKNCLDSLKGMCWKDDGQISKLEIERFEDPNDPRLEIWIWDRKNEEKGANISTFTAKPELCNSG